MGARQGAAVLRVIRNIAVRHGDEQGSDRDLLRRFVEQRDESAFTALVRRHGSMVMGVGLRTLRHHQDAEDICQATFLLLAKKAQATLWRDSVANWLYEVALHVALKARRAANRRNVREANVETRQLPDAWADMAVRELERVLDEELSRVAKKYRTPLILCGLEGKTRDEAARFLGVPLSTVNGRLEAGREARRRRLAGRGVLLSMALAGVTLVPQTAGAAVPATLARMTSQAALRAVTGEGFTNLVSANVASLVKGGIQAMLFTKLKVVAACGLLSAVACFAVACFAVWAVLANASAQESPKRSPALVAVGAQSAGNEKPRSGPGT